MIPEVERCVSPNEIAALGESLDEEAGHALGNQEELDLH
jgi:hypothetical protein